MTTSTSTWSFEHDGILGFMSDQRASTDAINALSKWASGDRRRSCEIVSGEDSDDLLVAKLTTDSDDSRSGDDLDAACKEKLKRTRA